MIKLENPTVGFNWKNAGLLVFFFVISVTAQSVLPWAWFGLMIAPVLWFLFILYVVLNRPFIQGLVLNYLLCFLLQSVSGVSLRILLLSTIVLTLLLNSVKKRFFVPGLQYFLGISIPSLLGFQIIYTILSKLAEPVSATYDFKIRFFELLITPLFAIPVFHILEWVDKKTLNPQSFRSEEII